MLVDRVDSVLLTNWNSSKELDYSMSDFEGSEEDVEMSEEPDDSLTLCKFQEGLRKEVLAKKGAQLIFTIQKKDRQEEEGERSG